MHIRKRNKKYFVVVQVKGQRIQKSFSDKPSCVQWGKDIEKKLNQYRTLSLNVKLTELIDRYIVDFTAHKKDVVLETQRWRKIQRDYKWLVNLTLADIESHHFNRFKNERIKDGNIAFNNDITLLKHLFKKCNTAWNYNIPNPIINIEKAKKNPYGSFRELSRYEYKQLLNSKYRLFFLIGRNTGMRPFSEILNLKTTDFDEYNKCFYIRQSKSNKSRTVIISDYLISQIKKHKSNTEYLCPFTKNGIESFFRRFKHRNNIEKLTVYDCTRRQCAKDVVRRKLPLPDIAKTFGWSWKTAHDMIELYSGAKALRNYD
jgi:integrase